jgi:IS5 family transposase
MSSTRKGNEWYFGMKLHVGVDSSSGVAHSATVSTANLHDSQVMEELLHGSETAVYGDRAYASHQKRQSYEEGGVRWRVQRRGHRHRALSDRDRQWNRRQSSVRAKVEHIFHVIKRLWGHRKVRYRGLAKNEAHYFSLLALANLYLKRRELCLHKA